MGELEFFSDKDNPLYYYTKKFSVLYYTTKSDFLNVIN